MTNDSLITDDNAETTTPAESTPAPEAKIGTFVTYISGKGKQKAALVLGTPETVEEGSSLGFTLNKGQLTLLVYSPSGRQEYKKHVDFAGTNGDTARVWQITA